jgi:hypothetical protein
VECSRELLEARIQALKEEMAQRFESHHREHEKEFEAVSLARREMERRLDGMNELRRQIDSERGQYIGREQYEASHNQMRDRIQNLETIIANFQGRFWMVAAVPSIAMIILNLILYFLKLKS